MIACQTCTGLAFVKRAGIGNSTSFDAAQQLAGVSTVDVANRVISEKSCISFGDVVCPTLSRMTHRNREAGRDMCSVAISVLLKKLSTTKRATHFSARNRVAESAENVWGL